MDAELLAHLESSAPPLQVELLSHFKSSIFKFKRKAWVRFLIQAFLLLYKFDDDNDDNDDDDNDDNDDGETILSSTHPQADEAAEKEQAKLLGSVEFRFFVFRTVLE